jgi:sulfite exporter TauE/SafE
MTIGWIEEAGEYFSIIGGIIMVIAGVAMLGIIPVSPRLSLLGSNKSVSKVQGELLLERTVGSKLALGFLTPLLPCGILYAMLAKAATTGNVLNGAVTMGLFAVGMAPSLILLGGVSSFFSARMRKGTEQVAAIMIILMGVILILRGFHVPYLSWLSGETKCPKCAS